MSDIKLVATDLDGTFLRNDRTISSRNIDALHLLGAKGILRVAATGRNLKKVKEVIGRDVPFDYVVYSSGAGIYNWQNKEHIFHQNIESETAGQLTGYFRNKEYNFSVFEPAPNNHILWYHKGGVECEEFNRFFSFHNGHGGILPLNGTFTDGLCQFVLIIPEDDTQFTNLKSEIEMLSDQIRVIRSSSPVTPGYIWVEVFHHAVSKGLGVKYLCDRFSLHPNYTAGIGNDYNDLDLLHFTNHSFITENAPGPVKSMFQNVPSNEEDAFFHAVQPLFI